MVVADSVTRTPSAATTSTAEVARPPTPSSTIGRGLHLCRARLHVERLLRPGRPRRHAAARRGGLDAPFIPRRRWHPSRRGPGARAPVSLVHGARSRGAALAAVAAPAWTESPTGRSCSSAAPPSRPKGLRLRCQSKTAIFPDFAAPAGEYADVPSGPPPGLPPDRCPALGLSTLCRARGR